MIERTVGVLNETVFPKYEEVQKKRALTLSQPRSRGTSQVSRGNRKSMLFTNTRSRSTTSTWQRAAAKAKKKKLGKEFVGGRVDENVDFRIWI